MPAQTRFTKFKEWKRQVEDCDARALVEQLVKDAAQVRIRQVKPSLPVERALDKTPMALGRCCRASSLATGLERQV